MEILMEISVTITECHEVFGVSGERAALLLFGGTVTGPYFTGEVLSGGVDTQRTPSGGVTTLSARYMLEGTDSSGKRCRVFVENNGSDRDGFTPSVVTDSELLASHLSGKLTAIVSPREGGVTVVVANDDS